MPAVKLDQLKLESANLAGKVSRPELFLPMLRELLSNYSNRTYRVQVSAGRLKPTPSYHVPEKVLWQLERDVLAQLRVHTQEQVLTIADNLWDAPSFEEKSLAIAILGEAAHDPVEPLVARFQQWYITTGDQQLTRKLVKIGSRSIRAGNRAEWKAIQQRWVSSMRTADLVSAIWAAADMLDIEGERCLPETLDLLSKILNTDDLAILVELLQLFQLVIKRSRLEAAFFLRKLAGDEERRNLLAERFISRSISLFPPEMQPELRRDIPIQRKNGQGPTK